MAVEDYLLGRPFYYPHTPTRGVAFDYQVYSYTSLQGLKEIYASAGDGVYCRTGIFASYKFFNTSASNAKIHIIELPLTASIMDSDLVQLIIWNESNEDLMNLPSSFFSDSENGANIDNNAGDVSLSNYWETTVADGGASGVAYIGTQGSKYRGYDGCVIVQKDSDSAIDLVRPQYSDDGISWSDVTSLYTSDGTIRNGHLPINKDGSANFIRWNVAGDHEYWRILAAAETGAGNWAVEYMQWDAGQNLANVQVLPEIRTVVQELAAAPSGASTLEEKITALYQYFFNKREVTASGMAMYQLDDVTSIGSAVLSDDGTTASKGRVT